MTPEELGAEVEAAVADVTARCVERVTGVGAQQYWVPGKPQKFETMPLDGLFEFAEEELRDLVVYAVMLHIRLGRLRSVLTGIPTPPVSVEVEIIRLIKEATHLARDSGMSRHAFDVLVAEGTADAVRGESDHRSAQSVLAEFAVTHGIAVSAKAGPSDG